MMEFHTLRCRENLLVKAPSNKTSYCYCNKNTRYSSLIGRNLFSTLVASPNPKYFGILKVPLKNTNLVSMRAIIHSCRILSYGFITVFCRFGPIHNPFLSKMENMNSDLVLAHHSFLEILADLMELVSHLSLTLTCRLQNFQKDFM